MTSGSNEEGDKKRQRKEPRNPPVSVSLLVRLGSSHYVHFPHLPLREPEALRAGGGVSGDGWGGEREVIGIRLAVTSIHPRLFQPQG